MERRFQRFAAFWRAGIQAHVDYSAETAPAIPQSSKAAVALLLTFAAGCVDIVGYLTLFRVFTAHMTGETVHLAEDVWRQRWPDAAKAAVVVAAFLAGSIVGRTIIEIGARTRVRSIASATLIMEGALICGVIPLAGCYPGGVPAVVLLAMLASAMGIQTATLTRVEALDLCLACKGCKGDCPLMSIWPLTKPSSCRTTGRVDSARGKLTHSA